MHVVHLSAFGVVTITAGLCSYAGFRTMHEFKCIKFSHALYDGRLETKCLSAWLSRNTPELKMCVCVGVCVCVSVCLLYPQMSCWHIWTCDNECIDQV